MQRKHPTQCSGRGANPPIGPEKTPYKHGRLVITSLFFSPWWNSSESSSLARPILPTLTVKRVGQLTISGTCFVSIWYRSYRPLPFVPGSIRSTSHFAYLFKRKNPCIKTPMQLRQCIYYSLNENWVCNHWRIPSEFHWIRTLPY